MLFVILVKEQTHHRKDLEKKAFSLLLIHLSHAEGLISFCLSLISSSPQPIFYIRVYAIFLSFSLSLVLREKEKNRKREREENEGKRERRVKKPKREKDSKTGCGGCCSIYESIYLKSFIYLSSIHLVPCACLYLLPGELCEK